MKHTKENAVRYLEVLKHLERLNKIKKCTRKSLTVIKSVSLIEPACFAVKLKEAKFTSKLS